MILDNPCESRILGFVGAAILIVLFLYTYATLVGTLSHQILQRRVSFYVSVGVFVNILYYASKIYWPDVDTGGSRGVNFIGNLLFIVPTIAINRIWAQFWQPSNDVARVLFSPRTLRFFGLLSIIVNIICISFSFHTHDYYKSSSFLCFVIALLVENAFFGISTIVLGYCVIRHIESVRDEEVVIKKRYHLLIIAIPTAMFMRSLMLFFTYCVWNIQSMSHLPLFFRWNGILWLFLEDIIPMILLSCSLILIVRPPSRKVLSDGDHEQLLVEPNLGTENIRSSLTSVLDGGLLEDGVDEESAKVMTWRASITEDFQQQPIYFPISSVSNR